MVRRRKGFTLLLVAIAFPVLLAVLGLAADLGRMYVVKNELQAFTDAASLAACSELDGTLTGISAARALAATGPTAGDVRNRWDFGGKTVTSVQSSFARTFAGPYDETPLSGDGYRFVRVTASVSVPLYFLPILPGVGSTTAVSASAVAGQGRETALGDGLAPFSPDAHDAAGADYGFTPGALYTLRWPPPGQRGKPGNSCAGDGAFVPAGGSNDRGYIDIGQGGGNSALYEAIVNNTFELPQTVSIGNPINMQTGQDQVGSAVATRFSQDTDTTSTTYSAYHGNGRRLLIVAVNDNTDASNIVGFALFFLPPNPCGPGNASQCCAEYVGPAVVNGRKRAAGGPGLYRIKLFE